MIKPKQSEWIANKGKASPTVWYRGLVINNKPITQFISNIAAKHDLYTKIF